jgi:short-subunit dehydrogenase
MREERLPVTVTELQPGFVDTAMLKTRTPLSPLIRRLLVADPSAAARQMLQAINRKEKHAYITRRYIRLAFLLKILPRPG